MLPLMLLQYLLLSLKRTAHCAEQLLPFSGVWLALAIAASPCDNAMLLLLFPSMDMHMLLVLLFIRRWPNLCMCSIVSHWQAWGHERHALLSTCTGIDGYKLITLD